MQSTKRFKRTTLKKSKQFSGESESLRLEAFEGAGQAGQGQADAGDGRRAVPFGGHQGPLHVPGPARRVAARSGARPRRVPSVLVGAD